MEKILSDTLEACYDDYLFIGAPKDDKEVVDTQVSADLGGLHTLIARMCFIDSEYKFFLLKAVMEAFAATDNDDEFDNLLLAMKKCKRARWRRLNRNQSRLNKTRAAYERMDMLGTKL